MRQSVLLRLIPPRVHAVLDDFVVLTYLMGAYMLELRGAAMGIALAGGFVHFFITRFTDYPAGMVKLLSFRMHAFIELAEGAAVLVATAVVLPASTPGKHRLFLTLLGIAQLAAFALSDYRWPAEHKGVTKEPQP